MATIVVEDGTGLATANSYVSLVDSETYFDDRGDTVWAAALDADKEAALIRATQAIDEQGNTRWKGTKSSATQALAWPRTDAVDSDGYPMLLVPVCVVRAACEAAYIELGSPGALNPSLSRGGMVAEERVEGAVTIKYFDGAPSATVYTTVSRALAPALKDSSYMIVTRG